MSKTKEWVPINDRLVRHRWVHSDKDEKCSGDKEVYVDPSYYADSGTPVCGECGRDYEYAGTEILKRICAICGEPATAYEFLCGKCVDDLEDDTLKILKEYQEALDSGPHDATEERFILDNLVAGIVKMIAGRQKK